jgi:hypothetical protein
MRRLMPFCFKEFIRHIRMCIRRPAEIYTNHLCLPSANPARLSATKLAPSTNSPLPIGSATNGELSI